MSPGTGKPFPRPSSSFMRTRWLHLIYFFFFIVFVAAHLKAAAIDVRCHSCTAPDVDAPATGGLLVPRTNTLLPPRFFAPASQFAGRWHGNACGGLPPRRPLLRSLSHSCAASQSNAYDITGGEIKVPRRWRRRREARAVKPAMASHRTETERQDPLALADGCRSGPVCWGALPFLFLRR